MTNEYISRDDAIIEMMDNDVDHAQGIDGREVVQILMDIPASDVVPVVRCGKCRYCTNNWHSSVYDLCKITGRNVIDTDFCNYGKKREE